MSTDAEADQFWPAGSKPRPHPRADHAYAIIRVDHNGQGAIDVGDLPALLTVKMVVWSKDEAEREVVRLNGLASARGSLYFWALARVAKQS